MTYTPDLYLTTGLTEMGNIPGEIASLSLAMTVPCMMHR
jgi:hypothetical protein